ncbi:MAG: hypothetical protein SFU25_10470, partial [Candidatus Caenarcaniphilales bacterium]|nr:hypothetical protein [Candidatus Caenarcaniphilales bacterium]
RISRKVESICKHTIPDKATQLAQQGITGSSYQRWLQRKQAAQTNRMQGQIPSLSSTNQEIVDEVREKGYAQRSLSEILPATSETFIKALEELSNSHNFKLLASNEASGVFKANLAWLTKNEALNSESRKLLFQYGLSPAFMGLANNYLNTASLGYHAPLIKLTTTVARKEILGPNEEPHRDIEASQIFRILIYGSDVGEKNGPLMIFNNNRWERITGNKVMSFSLIQTCSTKPLRLKRATAWFGFAFTLILYRIGPGSVTPMPAVEAF